MLDVDGSEKLIQSLAYFGGGQISISKANFLVLFKLAQQFELVYYSLNGTPKIGSGSIIGMYE